VSFGTHVPDNKIPKKLIDLFIDTFSRLPYRILWKWEGGEDRKDLPTNILAKKWFKQQDLLG